MLRKSRLIFLNKEEYFNARLPLLLIRVKTIQTNQFRPKYQKKKIMAAFPDWVNPQNSFNGRLLENNYRKI